MRRSNSRRSCSPRWRRASRRPRLGAPHSRRRRRRNLVVVAAVDAAHAQALALAGPVHGERVHAAAGEFEPGEKDAHLLGIVHAVDDDHGRGGARDRRLHEQSRQSSAIVGRLDELDVGMPQPDAGMIAAIGLAAPFALLVARRVEALGVVVVVAGAQVVVAGGVRAAGERPPPRPCARSRRQARPIPPTRPAAGAPAATAAGQLDPSPQGTTP